MEKYLLLMILCGVVTNAVSDNPTACYGVSRFDLDAFRVKCDEDEIIKVNNLYALTKPMSSLCPNMLMITDNETEVFSRCCTYEDGDCKLEYHLEYGYFSACVAKNTCYKRASNLRTTNCSIGNFPPDSNYMMLDFDCIPRKEILPITSNRTKTGNTSTVGSVGYPHRQMTSENTGHCSVSASCISNISVTALDLQFQMFSGHCLQEIEINDGVNTWLVDCASNTTDTRKPVPLYTSLPSFITLWYNSSLLMTDAPYWLEFTSSNPAAVIDIRCGEFALSQGPSIANCPQITSSSTMSTSTTLGTNTSETNEATYVSATGSTSHWSATTTQWKRTGAQNEKGQDGPLSTPAIVGIVLGILFLLILIILLIVFFYKKKKNNRVDSETSPIGGPITSDLGAGVPPTMSAIPRRLPPLARKWKEQALGPTRSTYTSNNVSTISGNTHWNTIKTNHFEINRNG